MAHIILVEDDAGVREQFSQLLRNAGHDVSCPDGFEQLADKIIAARPDLAVIDLGLPQTDGQYVVRELRQRSQVPILVLTSRTSELDELTSLSLGADDFVSKSTNPQLILAHVDALLRRSSRAVPSSVEEWGGVSLDLARSRASRGSASCELTRNELRILDQLMRATGAIVSRDELMEALWDTFDFVDDNTLTVNISHLRQKLAGIGARGYVVTHRGQGYALKELGR